MNASAQQLWDDALLMSAKVKVLQKIKCRAGLASKKFDELPTFVQRGLQKYWLDTGTFTLDPE